MGVLLSRKAKKVFKDPDYLWDKKETDRNVAYEVLSEYVKRAKDEGVPISQQGILRYASKHGFINTSGDREVIKSIFRKGRIKLKE